RDRAGGCRSLRVATWASAPRGVGRDEGEHDPRLAAALVEYGVVGDGPAAVAPDGLARVGVDVEARVIRARDVEPDAVAGHEEIARRVEGDDEAHGNAGGGELAPLAPVAVAQARDAVGEVERVAEGEPRARRVDVDELGREVRVLARRRHPQDDL